jgi:hypothetical protein
MTISKKELSTKQNIAFLACLSGATLRQASKKADVSRETMRRWFYEDPVFRSRYRMALDHIKQSISHDLQVSGQEAVSVLRDIMMDVEAQGQHRVAAAKTILDAIYKDHTRQLEARIEELERNRFGENENLLEQLPEEEAKQVIDILDKYTN